MYNDHLGILQVEAEGIQDYECPKCNPKSALNLANLKQLKSQDLDVIKKLFKQIQSSKHSVPFKKPMEKKTNKKYYELVKEPMGKQFFFRFKWNKTRITSSIKANPKRS